MLMQEENLLLKLLVKLAYLTTPAFKHSPAFKHFSASEVAQSILNVSKLQEHRVLPEADYQVLVHSFREDKVKIL